MTTFKINLADPENGKCSNYEVKDPQARALIGLRIGDTFDLSLVGLNGKARITGGSDRSGVPMRPDVPGPGRKYVLITKGIGLRKCKKGERRRKLVRGNTISDDIYQINAVIVK